jgi:hypothetical protein
MILKRMQIFYDIEGAGSGISGNESAGQSANSGGVDPSRTGLNSLAGANTSATVADAPTGYWPDGISDRYASMRGVDDKSTIDALLADITGRATPPEDPKGYKLQLSDELVKRFPEMEKDPVLDIWRDVAHKNGFNDQQFNGAISQLYGQLIEKGLMDPPINADAELEKLMPPRGTQTERNASALKRVNVVHDNINGLVTNGTISKEEARPLQGLASTAVGIQTLEKIFSSMGETGIKAGGSPAASISKDAVSQKMQDERYDSRSLKFDPKYRAQVDMEWQRAHGVIS